MGCKPKTLFLPPLTSRAQPFEVFSPASAQYIGVKASDFQGLLDISTISFLVIIMSLQPNVIISVSESFFLSQLRLSPWILQFNIGESRLPPSFPFLLPHYSFPSHHTADGSLGWGKREEWEWKDMFLRDGCSCNMESGPSVMANAQLMFLFYWIWKLSFSLSTSLL